MNATELLVFFFIAALMEKQLDFRFNEFFFSKLRERKANSLRFYR